MQKEKKKYLLLIVLILFFSTCYSQTRRIYSASILKCDTLKYSYSYGINNNFTGGSGYYGKLHYRVFDSINKAPKNISNKWLIISDSLRNKFQAKYEFLQLMRFVITSNSRKDSNIKYRVVMAYPTIDEMSIIFTLPFDKNFNLLVDSKFINCLTMDDFFTNLNPCKAIEKAIENTIFKEYYKNYNYQNIVIAFLFIKQTMLMTNTSDRIDIT